MLGPRSLLALAAVASSVSATIYTTNPTARTTWQANTRQTVTWTEDQNAPLAASFGRARVDLCTGSATQQACLVNIGTIVGTSTGSGRTFTTSIPASAGPTGQYFIRFLSLDAKDDNGVPLLSFSAQFTITGMKGPAPNLVAASGLAYVPPSAGATGTAAANTAGGTARAGAASVTPTPITAVSSGAVLAVASAPSGGVSSTSGAASTAPLFALLAAASMAVTAFLHF